jgi:hypothetical protein
MINRFALVAFSSVTLLASPQASAENSKAPCGSFQKLPDGAWNVLKPVKIEHGTTSATLNPGTSIKPGTRVTGVDLYAALQKGCQQANGPPNANGRQ